MNRRLLNRIIVYVFLGVMLVTSTTVLVWLYSSGEVLQINNGPVPVRPTSQRSDELVFLVVNFCKKTSASGTVRRFLVSNTVRIPLPLQTDTGPATCTQADVPLLIPKGVEPDIYRVHIDVEYQINPLRKVVNSLDSQSFTVE